MKLKAGDRATDFSLKDQHDTEHMLSDYHGSFVLLSFYPVDDVAKVAMLHGVYEKFKQSDVVVLCISTQSVDDHKELAEKHIISFPLLSDEGAEVVDLYGVWEKQVDDDSEYMGVSQVSFLIDPSGVVAKVYKKVKGDTHAQDVLRDVKKLQAE